MAQSPFLAELLLSHLLVYMDNFAPRAYAFFDFLSQTLHGKPPDYNTCLQMGISSCCF